MKMKGLWKNENRNAYKNFTQVKPHVTGTLFSNCLKQEKICYSHGLKIQAAIIPKHAMDKIK